MTEFETKLLAVLDNIHKEMVVASLPENYRKYQRELFAVKDQRNLFDKFTNNIENQLQTLMDSYVTEHPEYEGLSWDETVELNPEFIKLNNKAKHWAEQSLQMDKRIEQLCKNYKCVNDYE